METMKFIYYQEGEMWVGWLEEYPDYKSQGATLDELKESLKEIYADLDSGKIPCVRKYGIKTPTPRFHSPSPDIMKLPIV